MKRVLQGILVFALVVLCFSGAYAGTTERVSVDSNGNEGNGPSYRPAISGNGRYVSFNSFSTNLVPGDTNNTYDIFVHDRVAGATERVSVDSFGNEGNGGSSDISSISDDGRYVAFISQATNLVPGDTNNAQDIFVHDSLTGITERVSVDSNGNEGDGYSSRPSISGGGRYVAFISQATNLVPGDTNNAQDIFVHDSLTGITERVSVDSNGNEGNGPSYRPAISSDGRHVAFDSSSTNLVPGDTNNTSDIFVHDRVAGTTERVSVDSFGSEGDGYSSWPSVSGDGRYVAFISQATNLVPGDTNGFPDEFVHDRLTGITERVSVDSNGNQGDGSCHRPAISSDGRHVAFNSSSTNLVPGDTNNSMDIFVHDRATGLTERASVDSNGNQVTGGTGTVISISDDGRYVPFYSTATNLVPGDTNGQMDVFVRTRDLDKDADYFNEVDDCNDNDASIYPGAPEAKHDGTDQDCNGYDLTIDIVKASYVTAEDSLRVEATSSLGAGAALELTGNGPMTWRSTKLDWAITVQPAGGDPVTVEVCGVEGCETVQTVAE